MSLLKACFCLEPRFSSQMFCVCSRCHCAFGGILMQGHWLLSEWMHVAERGRWQQLQASCLLCWLIAAPRGQTSLLTRAANLQVGSLSVLVMDRIIWEFLAEGAVKCTESYCHWRRETEQRAHLRSHALLFFQIWCHLLLVSVERGHGPLLLLTFLILSRATQALLQVTVQICSPDALFDSSSPQT